MLSIAFLTVLCFYCHFAIGMIINNGLGHPEIVYPIRQLDDVKPQCKSIGKPLDLLVILDSSGSMRIAIEEEVNVAKDIVNMVAVQSDATRVALVQFSGYARTEFHFNTYKNQRQVLEKLDAVRPIAGVTRIGNAISHSFDELKADFGYRGNDVPTIAFVISDGRTQDYPQDAIEAEKMRSRGIDVWAYGTGEYVAIEELVNLTSDANKVVTRQNYHHLKELFDPFKSVDICEKVPVCIPGSDKPLDLVFVIDSSDSIQDKFQEQLAFVQRVVSHVNVHPDAVRIAAITYAAKPVLDFDFNRYDTNELVGKGVSELNSKNTTTRTDLALQLALEVFNGGSAHGVRNEGVPKMAIVITDGRSQRDPSSDAQRLAERNVTVFAVTLVGTEKMDEHELLSIAGNHANRVYTGSNLMEFEDEFKNYVSMGCPGVTLDGCIPLQVKQNIQSLEPIVRQPVDVQCKENSLVVNVRTLNPFNGKMYAIGHENDPKCFVIGQNETRTSITVAADTCGFRGSLNAFNGHLMLQFHPMIMTKIDQVIPVNCVVAGDRIQLKDSVSRPHDLSCSYSLRQYDIDHGCVVLDARVGDNLYHKWECNMSSNQAVLIHDCYAMADNQRTLQIVDDHGCEIDPYAFETPSYEKQHYVYRHFPIFKFPGSKWLSFKCQVSFCDKEAGECDGIVPPKCDEKWKSRRIKRQVNFIKTMQVETRGVNVLENMNMKHLEEVRYCNTYNI